VIKTENTSQIYNTIKSGGRAEEFYISTIHWLLLQPDNVYNEINEKGSYNAN
jgi:hypothetical protein